jgi:hypothetical protein
MPSRTREIISRPTAGRGRAFDIATVWGLSTALALLFAHVTAIGPTLLTLTRTHGVHLGDLVFAVLACAVAAMITLRIVREP